MQTCSVVLNDITTTHAGLSADVLGSVLFLVSDVTITHEGQSAAAVLGSVLFLVSDVTITCAGLSADVLCYLMLSLALSQ